MQSMPLKEFDYQFRSVLDCHKESNLVRLVNQWYLNPFLEGVKVVQGDHCASVQTKGSAGRSAHCLQLQYCKHTSDSDTEKYVGTYARLTH